LPDSGGLDLQVNAMVLLSFAAAAVSAQSLNESTHLLKTTLPAVPNRP
jgi:hypothetical protein